VTEQRDKPALPFRLADLLAGAHYAAVLGLLFIGLIIWFVTVRIELSTVHQHLDDLDQHGTTALRERVQSLELTLSNNDQRGIDAIRRFNDVQAQVNKTLSDLSIVMERQNNNAQAIKELRQQIERCCSARREGGAPESRPR
jgi:hypothetical protein